MKVEIFTTPTCSYCASIKEFLNEKNISYIEHNVAVDEEARMRMVQISSQLGVPVTIVDGQVIVGFDRKSLEKAFAKAA